MNKLIEILTSQKTKKIKNIDDLFKPSNYLVSPFNSTRTFIQGKYFLTSQQNEFKKQIIQELDKPKHKFISITGQAGCGKTLLTYDIGKEIRKDKKVLFIHCGQLNEGHIKLRDDYSWKIISVKHINSTKCDGYDVIIIDEAQRIYNGQLKNIIELVKKNCLKCIFSYDQNQILKSNETSSIVIKESTTNTYKLTTKIRTNKQLANFIRCLFNKRKPIEFNYYPNINIQYFTNNETAINYVNFLRKKKWQFINYTPERYGVTNYDYTIIKEEINNSHRVIGQEFNNIVLIIPRTFYYNTSNQLSVRGSGYYDLEKMFYQNITRTKNKLCLVIVNNISVLNRCMEILNN